MTKILERYGQHLKPGNLQIHQTVLLQRDLNLNCVQPTQVKINYRDVLCSLDEQMVYCRGPGLLVLVGPQYERCIMSSILLRIFRGF